MREGRRICCGKPEGSFRRGKFHRGKCGIRDWPAVARALDQAPLRSEALPSSGLRALAPEEHRGLALPVSGTRRVTILMLHRGKFKAPEQPPPNP